MNENKRQRPHVCEAGRWPAIWEDPCHISRGPESKSPTLMKKTYQLNWWLEWQTEPQSSLVNQPSQSMSSRFSWVKDPISKDKVQRDQGGHPDIPLSSLTVIWSHPFISQTQMSSILDRSQQLTTPAQGIWCPLLTLVWTNMHVAHTHKQIIHLRKNLNLFWSGYIDRNKLL